MEITWMSGSGFIIEQENNRLVVDPYLSDIVEKTMGWTRMVPNPVKLEELRPDMVFSTHDHLDHLDPMTIPEIAGYYPNCFFAGPKSVSIKLSEMGIDKKRIITVKAGMQIKKNNFIITPTPAYHSDSYAAGLIISNDGRKIYISGDTSYRPGLAKKVLDFSHGEIDLALTCINGKYNNMAVDEAVLLIKRIQPRLASPMHYGLFCENTANPLPFLAKCKKIGIDAFLFEPGKTVNIDKLITR